MSALASLDPSTVERIRELMRQPSTGKDAQNARPAAPASPNPAAPTVRSTPRPVASVPLSSAPAASSPSSAAAQGSSSTARPAGPASAAGRGVGAASTTTSAQPRPVAAVVPPATARPSVPTAANAPAPSQPAAQVSASGAARPPATDQGHRRRQPRRKPGPLHPLEFAPSGTIRGRPRIASWRWTPLGAHASPRNRDSPRRRRPGPHSFGRVTPLQNTGLITGGSGRTGRRPGDCEFPTLEAERLHVFGGNPPTRPAHHAGVVPTLGAGPPPRRRCPHRGSASRATRCSSSSLASGGCAQAPAHRPGSARGLRVMPPRARLSVPRSG